MSTLKDVAERAGVTVTTVSRVINNRGYISEKTRKKVNDAMREIGYRPNEVARSLSRRNTNTIGVITPRIDHPYYSKLVGEIEAAAVKENCKITLCCLNNEEKNVREFIGMFKADQALGAILCGCSTWIDRGEKLSFPIVTVGDVEETGGYSVQCDNYEGGVLAANTLIHKGGKCLMYIGRERIRNKMEDMKKVGFSDGCNQGDVAHIELMVSEETNCAKNIICALRGNPEVDGIFAGGDLIAAAALKACFESGKKVPKDIKIIGFGDTDVAALTIPSLSSVWQPMTEMARMAVAMVLKKKQGGVVPNKMVLPVKVVERESTS